MGLLDARYTATKGKFQAMYAKATSLGCTAISEPIQQELDYDSSHTTLQTNSQNYSNTFKQKTGLNSAGFNLIDPTMANMTAILSDSCSIMKNITDGNIYDAIDSTLDLMGVATDCATITSFLPTLDTNNSQILSDLDIYAVADDLENALQGFVSNFGFATNIFTAGPAFFDTLKCCMDQVNILDPNIGAIKNILNNAFNSLVLGLDLDTIIKTIKNDIANMLNLPSVLSGLSSRITGNSLYGPRTC